MASMLERWAADDEAEWWRYWRVWRNGELISGPPLGTLPGDETRYDPDDSGAPETKVAPGDSGQ